MPRTSGPDQVPAVVTEMADKIVLLEGLLRDLVDGVMKEIADGYMVTPRYETWDALTRAKEALGGVQG